MEQELNTNYNHKDYIPVIQKAVDNGYVIKDGLSVEEMAMLAPPTYFLLDKDFASKAGFSISTLKKKVKAGENYIEYITNS